MPIEIDGTLYRFNVVDSDGTTLIPYEAELGDGTPLWTADESEPWEPDPAWPGTIDDFEGESFHHDWTTTDDWAFSADTDAVKDVVVTPTSSSSPLHSDDTGLPAMGHGGYFYRFQARWPEVSNWGGLYGHLNAAEDGIAFLLDGRSDGGIDVWDMSGGGYGTRLNQVVGWLDPTEMYDIVCHWGNYVRMWVYDSSGEWVAAITEPTGHTDAPFEAFAFQTNSSSFDYDLGAVSVTDTHPYTGASYDEMDGSGTEYAVASFDDDSYGGLYVDGENTWTIVEDSDARNGYAAHRSGGSRSRQLLGDGRGGHPEFEMNGPLLEFELRNSSGTWLAFMLDWEGASDNYWLALDSSNGLTYWRYDGGFTSLASDSSFTFDTSIYYRCVAEWTSSGVEFWLYDDTLTEVAHITHADPSTQRSGRYGFESTGTSGGRRVGHVEFHDVHPYV